MVALAGAALPLAAAEVEPLGTCFRADQAFPQFAQFWHEGWNMPDDEGQDVGSAYDQEATSLAGSLHVFLRNNGRQPIAVRDVSLEGISLGQALVSSGQRKVKKFTSVHFSKLSPAQKDRIIAAGEPIWWKVDPPAVPPDGTAEVVVRLRQRPKAANVQIGIEHSGGTLAISLPVGKPVARVESAGFAPDLRQVYLYFRHPDGQGRRPTSVLLDGVDVTRSAVIPRDDQAAVIPVELRLPRALEAGSYHCIQAKYGDQVEAIASIRAASDEFAYGIFGGWPGKDGDATIGRSYITDITSHNLNVQMPQIGSAAVLSYIKSEAGRRYIDSRGLRFVLPDVGKFGVRNPIALWIHDEPDCGDYRAEGLPMDKKVGVLAQWCIEHSNELYEADSVTPRMLNVDMTFKPHNWYTYGQLPDILAVDPYYQQRLRGAYWTHPQRVAMYAKATYVYACAVVCQSACSPKPLHVILNAVRHTDKANKRQFRFATPQEKRIEVYYALAAGAKGLSYWWYTPAAPSYGVGAAAVSSDPEATALWAEIGLLGAEVRTAGPILLTSCPVDVDSKVPPGLWVRGLLGGRDTLVLLITNEQYTNDRVGTVYVPVEKATATVRLPAWLKPAEAFEITANGVANAQWTADGGSLTLDLGTVDLTRMIVVTADKALRPRLAKVHQTHLAANTTRLTREAR